MSYRPIDRDTEKGFKVTEHIHSSTCAVIISHKTVYMLNVFAVGLMQFGYLNN